MISRDWRVSHRIESGSYLRMCLISGCWWRLLKKGVFQIHAVSQISWKVPCVETVISGKSCMLWSLCNLILAISLRMPLYLVHIVYSSDFLMSGDFLISCCNTWSSEWISLIFFWVVSMVFSVKFLFKALSNSFDYCETDAVRELNYNKRLAIDP
jgi:hypothetical protein